MFIRGYEMRFIRKGERGQTIVFVGVAMLMLIGFLGLAIDAGRAYLVRAQLSKALDAAVLAGGKSGAKEEAIPKIIQKSFKANFRPGYMGAKDVSPSWTFIRRRTSQGVPVRVISATATTELPTIFMKVLGLDSLTVGTSAAVERKLLRLVLALDNSDSIGEEDLSTLKDRAKNLVNMLSETDDRVGLLTFAGDVVWRARLHEDGFNKQEIFQQINAIKLAGWTAGGPGLAEAWQELSVRPIPGSRCIPGREYKPDSDEWRVIVYFTDGAPNVIRSDFSFNDCGGWPFHRIGEGGVITTCGAHIGASEDDSLREPLRMDGLFRPVSVTGGGELDISNDGSEECSTDPRKRYTEFGFSQPRDCAIFIQNDLGGCEDVRRRFDIGPGFLRLPLKDYYNVSLASVAGVTAERNIFSIPNVSRSSDFLQIAGPFGGGSLGDRAFRKVINGMARNNLENVADAARKDGIAEGFPGITIFTIGLDGAGELTAQSNDWNLETGQDILRRIANVTQEEGNPQYNPGQPKGMYAYAKTGADLERAFNRIAGAILRLTK